MTEIEKTAVTGSEPVKVITAVAGAVPVQDAKVDSSVTEKPIPFDQDPRWKSARLAEQKLESILKANNLEDVDDLAALVASGRKVHGKQIDLDNLDKIVEDSKTLNKYQKIWAQEDEKKRRMQEDPDQTIVRLERKAAALQEAKDREEQEKKQDGETQKAIAFYEGEVKSLIETTDLSASEKEFVSWSLGVGNDIPFNECTDKKQIKKVVNSGLKKYTDLVKEIRQQGIQDYLAGKEKIPIVPSGGDSPATASPEKPKSLRALREQFKEAFTKGG